MFCGAGDHVLPQQNKTLELRDLTCKNDTPDLLALDVLFPAPHAYYVPTPPHPPALPDGVLTDPKYCWGGLAALSTTGPKWRCIILLSIDPYIPVDQIPSPGVPLGLVLFCRKDICFQFNFHS